MVAYNTAADWSDEVLLGQMLMRRGDAWKEFHRRFDRLVYRCIHKVIRRFPQMVCSEDVQEVYAMFLLNLTRRDMRKLRKYEADRGSKLSSWLGLIATNTAWDYLRTMARQPQTGGVVDADQLRSWAPDPCDEIVQKERIGLVNQSLRSFSSKDQTFMRLYYVDELSPEEIAAKMRISVKTVYSKKHKIRNRLEQVLVQEAA